MSSLREQVGDAMELSGSLISRCRQARALIQRPNILTEWGAQERVVSAQLTRLIDEVERAQRPLTILLLGGTGVGKSTLLNALAGEEVSKASRGRRAYTSELHIYHHVERSIEHLKSSARAVSVPHTATQLIDKIIIDAPDIDSTEHQHHDLVWSCLDEVDVILYVTTWQKYRNRAITQSLERIAGAHNVLCVLNQSDELTRAELSEVSEDVKSALSEVGIDTSYILSLSALSARRAQQGERVDPSAIEGFNQLNQLLRVELTMAEVRGLTQLSATRSALRSIGLIPQRMGWGELGFEGMVQALNDTHEELERRIASMRNRLESSLTAQASQALYVAQELDFQLQYRGVRGPYGVYLSVGQWLARHGYGAPTQAMTDEAQSLASERWIDELVAEVSQISAQQSVVGRRYGWEGALQARTLSDHEREQLKGSIQSLVTEPLGRAPRRAALSDVSLNAWPWLVTFLITYWLLERVMSGPEPGLVSLVFGVLVIYGACSLQATLLRMNDRRSLGSMVDQPSVSAFINRTEAINVLQGYSESLKDTQRLLSELLTISQELARLHNQMNEMQRVSEHERSMLLRALYSSGDTKG